VSVSHVTAMCRCNEDEVSCVKIKPMLGREMSMSGVDVDSDSHQLDHTLLLYL